MNHTARALLLAALALVAACGQMGPLYPAPPPAEEQGDGAP